jgi:hypothetical protein
MVGLGIGQVNESAGTRLVNGRRFSRAKVKAILAPGGSKPYWPAANGAGLICSFRGIGEATMFKSALFYAQLQAFFAGFFLCAAVSNYKHHPSNALWISFSILTVVLLLWSKRYAEMLRRKVPPLGEIKISDL